jgi:hypothetical protein
VTEESLLRQKCGLFLLFLSLYFLSNAAAQEKTNGNPASPGSIVSNGDAKSSKPHPSGDTSPTTVDPAIHPEVSSASPLEPSPLAIKPIIPVAPKFNWRTATKQSTVFLSLLHTFRLAQNKTRENLGGSYWQDYVASIRGVPGRWSDGDSALTAYVGHPIMGAMAGYIQIQNDPKGVHLQFENSREYWVSRLKATGWSALYSTQFEIGPFLSEASIGNVGMKKGTSGYVDFVTTPVGGLGFIVLEDWIDKAWIEKREMQRSDGRWRHWRRVLLNPNRSVANLLRLKAPSHRDTRPQSFITTTSDASSQTTSNSPPVETNSR